MAKLNKLKLLWVAGNIALVGKYYWDATSIQCEPCPPSGPCPPCETDFMSNVWMYFLCWNLLAIVLLWIVKKKRPIAAEKIEVSQMDDQSQILEQGKTLFESVPSRARPGWGVTLLQAFENFIKTVPDEVKDLYKITENENDWNLAHAQFTRIRKYSLANRRFQPESYLMLAEKVAKITYNESGRDAPFDADSGWHIPKLARQTADKFDNQELKTEIERILTVNMNE
jgi:hypothetical protein